ncbi:hypothetical protein LINPERHAP1_LOCUS30694 [Linum perenne]
MAAHSVTMEVPQCAAASSVFGTHLVTKYKTKPDHHFTSYTLFLFPLMSSSDDPSPFVVFVLN